MYTPIGEGQPPRIPSHNNSNEEYPLNETNFVEHVPQQSPFSDPYPLENSYSVETIEPRMPVYDNQPLLSSNPTAMPSPIPYPENNHFSTDNVYLTPNPPPPFNQGNNDPAFFTGAPRRQPRRYKTSE